MQRIDKFLVIMGYFPSREKAQSAIKAGQVFVNGRKIDCAFKVSDTDKISVSDEAKYVSRGAHKLLGAKDKFALNFEGRVVLDIGASTGGFTQVALEGGAKKVYALDVGEGQLAQRLKEDPRVVELSKTDFRLAPKFEDVDMIVSDLSFISLRHIIPKIVLEYAGVEGVILFKPQFECGPAEAKKHYGVVRDKKLHEKLLNDFIEYLQFFKITISHLDYSPITGKNGNIEYLFHINGKKGNINVKKVVDKAFNSL